MQGRVLALVLLLLTGCIARESDGRDTQPEETAAEVANPALRQELLALEQADQAIRAELISRGYENLTPEDVAREDAVDAANVAELQRIVDQHGWPTAALVGQDGVGAQYRRSLEQAYGLAFADSKGLE